MLILNREVHPPIYFTNLIHHSVLLVGQDRVAHVEIVRKEHGNATKIDQTASSIVADVYPVMTMN